MPTYEYQCTKCDRVFEHFQSIKAKPLRTMATQCAQCNNKAPVQRLIGSGAGVIFKGSGFYETDYRSDSYKAGQKAEKDAASPKDASKGSSKDGAKDSGKKKDSAGAKTTGGGTASSGPKKAATGE